MNKPRTVRINEYVDKWDIGSEDYQRIVYAGMPSEHSFSLICESGEYRRNPQPNSACEGSVIAGHLVSRQLFFPVGTKKIDLKIGRLRAFKIESVTPEDITVVLEAR